MREKNIIGIFSARIFEQIPLNYLKSIQNVMGNDFIPVGFSGSADKIRIEDDIYATRHLFKLAERIDMKAIVILAESIVDKYLLEQAIAIGKTKSIPIFLIDAEATDMNGQTGVYRLSIDYDNGFADMVRHLIEVHNAKKIVMLAGMKGNSYSEERIEAFRKEMKAHGLAVSQSQILYGDFWEIPAQKAINQYLDEGNEIPDAIVCANDSMAIAVVKELQKRGLNVPEDVIVSGFDGIIEGKHNIPAITTGETDYRAAAEYIAETISNRHLPGEGNFFIPVRLQLSESCGCREEQQIEIKKELVETFDCLRRDAWQNYFLNRMQNELMDSRGVKELCPYLSQALEMYSGNSHFICIRTDIEKAESYDSDFTKLRPLIMENFIGTYTYEDVFSAEYIMPDFMQQVHLSENGDVFIIHLIHSGRNVYGYHIERTKKLSGNELQRFDEFDNAVATIIDGLIRNIRLHKASTELAEAYEKISQLYLKDTMTDLYNRRGFYEKMEEKLKNRDKDCLLNIISFDMDNLKFINDNYGHHEGDYAIISIADAMKHMFQEDDDVCARFGGDEFVVASFTGEKEENLVQRISGEINDYLTTCTKRDQKAYQVQVSTGVCQCKLTEKINLENMIMLADNAMYRDKRNKKEK